MVRGEQQSSGDDASCNIPAELQQPGAVKRLGELIGDAALIDAFYDGKLPTEGQQ